MTGKITKLPALDIGGVYDLSYRGGGLPNRVYVENVFMREQDSEWQYHVRMESTGGATNLAESFISDRLCHKDSKAYRIPDVIKRYNDGYRWCGNFPKGQAEDQAKLIAQNQRIEHVKLYPAINPSGIINSNQYAIWIKWNYTIDYDGWPPIDDCVKTIK